MTDWRLYAALLSGLLLAPAAARAQDSDSDAEPDTGAEGSEVEAADVESTDVAGEELVLPVEPVVPLAERELPERSAADIVAAFRAVDLAPPTDLGIGAPAGGDGLTMELSFQPSPDDRTVVGWVLRSTTDELYLPGGAGYMATLAALPREHWNAGAADRWHYHLWSETDLSWAIWEELRDARRATTEARDNLTALETRLAQMLEQTSLPGGLDYDALRAERHRVRREARQSGDGSLRFQRPGDNLSVGAGLELLERLGQLESGLDDARLALMEAERIESRWNERYLQSLERDPTRGNRGFAVVRGASATGSMELVERLERVGGVPRLEALVLPDGVGDVSALNDWAARGHALSAAGPFGPRDNGAERAAHAEELEGLWKELAGSVMANGDAAVEPAALVTGYALIRADERTGPAVVGVTGPGTGAVPLDWRGDVAGGGPRVVSDRLTGNPAEDPPADEYSYQVVPLTVRRAFEISALDGAEETVRASRVGVIQARDNLEAAMEAAEQEGLEGLERINAGAAGLEALSAAEASLSAAEQARDTAWAAIEPALSNAASGSATRSGSLFQLRGGYLLLLVLIASVGAMMKVFTDQVRAGREIFIRRIPGIDAIEEGIGRATEMGRPVLYVPGIDDLQDIQTIASMLILGRVAEMIAEYDSDVVVSCCRPIVREVADEVVKAGFFKAGRPDAYDPLGIRFISSEQFAFTAGTNGIIHREKPATNIYLGRFFAESLILAETGFVNGSIQVAGTAEATQLPFFIAACDYTLIGEELFAVSAYLSKDPRLVASLKASDWVKVVIIAVMLLGTLLATTGLVPLASVQAILSVG